MAQTSSFQTAILFRVQELKGCTQKRRMSFRGEERERNWIGGGGPLCSGLDHGYSWVDNTDVDVIA
ncbi:hypothetical protein Q5P01_025087 [Channa striata]|uniref:Uncharacterized protein n=1 Tax=Channa striata TaxID=64152 RepID=A0AA88IP00_CHASR|nr:hypothetical protein Q5P01_025087 [Channa striata]